MKNFVYEGKIKKLIFLILLLSSAVMVFSQTVLESDVFPQIDGAFMEKNPAKVSAILTKYRGTSYYKIDTASSEKGRCRRNNQRWT